MASTKMGLSPILSLSLSGLPSPLSLSFSSSFIPLLSLFMGLFGLPLMGPGEPGLLGLALYFLDTTKSICEWSIYLPRSGLEEIPPNRIGGKLFPKTWAWIPARSE